MSAAVPPLPVTPETCTCWAATRLWAAVVVTVAVVPPAFPSVAAVHRIFAYVATALLVVQGATGFLRMRAHPALGVAFLAVVSATYVLAIIAYGLGR